MSNFIKQPLIKVYSGRAYVGDVYRTSKDDRDGILLGGVDFLKDVMRLQDKRKKYWVALHRGVVVQGASSGKFTVQFNPIFETIEKSKLGLAVGTGDEPDRFVAEEVNLVDTLKDMDNHPVTLVVSDGEDLPSLLDLPKPEGTEYQA